MKKFFIGALTLISLFFSIGCKADVRPKATVGDHPIYTLTFDSNNGSGDTTIQTGEYGRSIVLNENTFTYAYHTYTGWSTKPNSKLNSAVLYEDQDDFLVVNNQTLYAVWEPHDVRIKFYFSNSGTNLGTPMDDYTFAACLGGKLPNCTFALEGKGFRGWATNPGSTTVVYKDGQNIPAGFFESSENGMKTVSLYAVWETPDYWVTFYPNGGSGSAIKQGFFIGEKQPLLPCTFTKTDYVLKGWSTTSSPSVDASIDYYPEEEITVTGSKSLYAVWSQHKTVIKYVANGGEGSMANTEFFYSTGTTIRYNSFTRDHYTFKGWNTKSDGSGISYSSGEKVTLSTRVDEIILYAQWEIQKYTLTYFFNKPTPETTYSGSMTNTTVEYGQTVVVQENKFYCEHYTFQGFNTKADGSGKTIAVGTQLALTDDVGNVILYAQWKAKQYTITYHYNKNQYNNELTGNRLKDSTETQTYTFGTDVTLKANYGFSADWDTVFQSGKVSQTTVKYAFKGWGDSATTRYVRSSNVIKNCNEGDFSLYGVYYFENGPVSILYSNKPVDYVGLAHEVYISYGNSSEKTDKIDSRFTAFDKYIHIGYALKADDSYYKYTIYETPRVASDCYDYDYSTGKCYFYKPTAYYAMWFEFGAAKTYKGSGTYNYNPKNDSNAKARIYSMDVGLSEVTNQQYYQVMGSYTTYSNLKNKANVAHAFKNYEIYYFIDKLNYLAGKPMQYYITNSSYSNPSTGIPTSNSDSKYIYNIGTNWYESLKSGDQLYCARKLNSFRVPDEYEWLYFANGDEDQISTGYTDRYAYYNYRYAGNLYINAYYINNSKEGSYYVAHGDSTKISLNQLRDVCGNMREVVHYNGLCDILSWNTITNYTDKTMPFATRVYDTTSPGVFKSKVYGGGFVSNAADCETLYGNCHEIGTSDIRVKTTDTISSKDYDTVGLRMVIQRSWYFTY